MNRKQRKRAEKRARQAALAAQQQQPSPSDPEIVIDVDATRMAPKDQPKITRQVQAFSFSGPLPPPQLLSQYNEVVPYGAERLMKMAEVQQTHRQDLEKTVVHGNVQSERRGQWMGLFISIFVITAGTYLAATGKQITGGLLVGVDVVALASVFVYGKHSQRRQLDDKKEPLKRR